MVGWYDYGARMYNPRLGRWLAQDPLMRLYDRISPYAYCFNSPLNYIDQWGLQPKEPEGVDIDPVIILGPFLKTKEKKILSSFQFHTFMDELRNSSHLSADTDENASSGSPGLGLKPHPKEDRDPNLRIYPTCPTQPTSSSGFDPIRQAVYQGHRNFLIGTLGFGGRVLEVVGNGLTYGGALISCAGFGAAAGAPSMELGTMLSTVGGFMQIGYEYRVTKSINWMTVGSNIVGFGYGRLARMPSLTEAEKVVAQYLYGIPFSSLSLAEYMTSD